MKFLFLIKIKNILMKKLCLVSVGQHLIAYGHIAMTNCPTSIYWTAVIKYRHILTTICPNSIALGQMLLHVYKTHCKRSSSPMHEFNIDAHFMGTQNFHWKWFDIYRSS